MSKLWVGYLTTLTVLSVYSVDDKAMNQYGAVGGMRIVKENEST
jgi:hypothetical protein